MGAVFGPPESSRMVVGLPAPAASVYLDDFEQFAAGTAHRRVHLHK
jgi:hypothetical protein